MKPSTTKVILGALAVLGNLATAALAARSGANAAHDEHKTQLEQLMAEQKVQGERLSTIEGYLKAESELRHGH